MTLDPATEKRMIPRLALIVALLTASAMTGGARASEASAADLMRYQGLVDQYCLDCHDAIENRGDLALDEIDIGDVHRNAAILEKLVVKLRGRSMPPVGRSRPDEATYDAFAGWLEEQLDNNAAADVDPGESYAHRLNRSEYANSVRDLLAVEIDPAVLLPPDNESNGFDNTSNVLTPSLLDRYLNAAWEVSRTAVGTHEIQPSVATYRITPDASQWEQMAGLPLGTFGGMRFEHQFPLDGEYEFRVRLWRTPFDTIRGLEEVHEVEVAVDGERIFVGRFGGIDDMNVAADSTRVAADLIDDRLRVRAPVKAGQHSVTVAFLQKSAALVSHSLQPYERTNQDILNYYGRPHLDRVSVGGPYTKTGVSETASRRRIFVCTPAKPADEPACARRILTSLARQAYRRPITNADADQLMAHFERGRKQGPFDIGVAVGVRAILANPEFVYRWEPDPESVKAGSVYRLDGLQVASRLALFLWSSIPDEELLDVAIAGKLTQPATLERQVKRMLADRKADALVENFAGQWLYLRNLRSTSPDSLLYPDWDDNLRQAFRTETEMFVRTLFREDRSILDFLDGDYTYLNDRLARHYGIDGVVGKEFRRVTVEDPRRFGLFGKGSTLATTVYPTRTSPVLRGKWVLTHLLGMPPAPPPPDVPALKENDETGVVMTVRQRLEMHRANPSCASCHDVMDPIGYALENFDAVAAWRTKGEDGQPIDTSGKLANGITIDGVEGLRKALLDDPKMFMEAFTRQLMTYALGRGLGASDMPEVRRIVREAAGDDYRFSSMILGIVNSVPFQMKRKMIEPAAVLTDVGAASSAP